MGDQSPARGHRSIARRPIKSATPAESSPPSLVGTTVRFWAPVASPRTSPRLRLRIDWSDWGGRHRENEPITPTPLRINAGRGDVVRGRRRSPAPTSHLHRPDSRHPRRSPASLTTTQHRHRVGHRQPRGLPAPADRPGLGPRPLPPLVTSDTGRSSADPRILTTRWSTNGRMGPGHTTNEAESPPGPARHRPQ